MSVIKSEVVESELGTFAVILQSKYKGLLTINFDSSLYDSHCYTDMKFPISKIHSAEIVLGTKMLEESRSENYMSFEEFVLAVKNLFHEYRHFEQEYYFYQDKNPTDDILFMAQMRYISRLLPEFKRCAEFRLPSEVDAELYGWLKTVDYFDNQGVDVRDVLYQDIIRKRENGYGWYGDLNTWDYDSAVQSLKDNLNYLKQYKVDFVNCLWENVKDWESETDVFQKFKSKGFADAYNRAESISEALHILFTFATKQESVICCHFPCLKDSIKEGKRDYRCKRADRLDGLKDHNIFKYIEQKEGHEQMSSEQQRDDFSF